MMVTNFENPVDGLIFSICDHTPEGAKVEVGNTELFEILCGRDKIDGLDFPVGKSYPFVAKAMVSCAKFTLFVEEQYIAGISKDGETASIIGSLNPWNEEAIRRYILPDTWTLKNWVFSGPGGSSFPYVPGIKINLETGDVVSITAGHGGYEEDLVTIRDREEIDSALAEAKERFDRARSRVNNYVDKVLRVSNVPDYEYSGDVPTTLVDTVDMMYNTRVPRNLKRDAVIGVYGNIKTSENKAMKERQALVAWCCEMMKVPMMVFDKQAVYTLPK